MLLRRIIGHLKTQSWLAIGIDFFIVVVGVFLGLQAQVWSEQRIDRDKEKNYLGRLAQDFEAITADLEQCLTVYRESVDAINYVARQLEADAEPQAADLNTALIRMTGGAIPAGRSTTFMELISSGEFGILQQESLRNALIVYDQRAQINREAWRSVREDAGAYQQPLYDSIVLDVDLSRENFVTITAADFDRMKTNPAFRSMLNVLAGANANSYELCLRQREIAQSVRDVIE